MKGKDLIVLKKILGYCEQVNEACDMFEHDYDRFVSSSVFHNACCMCILQIGELCKVISSELREDQPDIPLKQWCGIRDIFAHQYSNMDYQSAWETVTKDLPELKSSIEKVLKEEKTAGQA